MESIEYKRLLIDDEEGSIYSPESDISSLRRKVKRQALHLRLLYTALLILLISLGWGVLSQRRVDLQVYSPVNDLIRYKATVFYDNIEEISPYQGEPDDTKDNLWDDLYRDTETTRVSASSAAQLPNRTMVLPGTKSDGIVMFEVFHQLHCLNALRKSLYPDRFPDYSVFFPNGTRDPTLTKHHNHCIDRIRQEIMCMSDTGHSYWRWNERLQKWWVNMETTHTCRNFDDIRRWAVERNVGEWDPTVPSRLTP